MLLHLALPQLRPPAAPRRSPNRYDGGMETLDRQQEADRLLSVHEGAGGWAAIMQRLEAQMNVLHGRTQVLLTLCGVVVTVTGFSGRIIAGTSLLAKISIITGLTLVLVAAAVGVFGVLPVKWLTQQPGNDPRGWLLNVLTYRDRKTVAYRWATALLLLGLAVYVISIALMLLTPGAPAAPAMYAPGVPMAPAGAP
jgi:hypothetical protein